MATKRKRFKTNSVVNEKVYAEELGICAVDADKERTVQAPSVSH